MPFCLYKVGNGGLMVGPPRVASTGGRGACAARESAPSIPASAPPPVRSPARCSRSTRSTRKETSMRQSIVRSAIVTAMLLALAQPAAPQTLKGPVSDKPLTEGWAPSKWGANDRAGSANYTNDPANVARALATVKQNKVITIGKYYHREAPAFGPRGWQLVIPGTPTGGPFGNNALIYHDELVIAELGQIGTQFDGPGHIGVNTSKGSVMYNGITSWDAYERGPGTRVMGMGPLGVEHVGEIGFVCRLVVLDAVAYKKSKGQIPATAEMLPIPTKPGDPGIVTADDVKGIMQMQG